MLNLERISIIGAGNGGQAMAGHLSLMGHEVKVYKKYIIGKTSKQIEKKLHKRNYLGNER